MCDFINIDSKKMIIVDLLTRDRLVFQIIVAITFKMT